MLTPQLHFIVIDDSKLNCFIAEKIILSNKNAVSVSVFMEATEALEYIKSRPDIEIPSRTLIVVDIQMPVMNGFEFVESFEKLPESIRKQYDIFMISSSVNSSDHTRVSNYPSVKKLLQKPLTKEMLAYIIDFEIN